MIDRTQDAPVRAEDERLIDYLYDEMSAAERSRFEAELASDPALASELATLRATRSQLEVLPVEPMPRGLLDDVLALADQQAAVFAREAAPTSWWQRLSESLRRLAFQPAFAMGLVLLLVAGVALVATRDPSQIPGLELPRDTQRLPEASSAAVVVAEGFAAAPAPVEVQVDPMGASGVLEAELAAVPEEVAPATVEVVAATGVQNGHADRQRAPRATGAQSRHVKRESVGVLSERKEVAADAASAERPKRAAPAATAELVSKSTAEAHAAAAPREEPAQARRAATPQVIDALGERAEVAKSSPPVSPARETSAGSASTSGGPALTEADQHHAAFIRQVAGQQWGEAERSIAALVKLEGESPRVKKARDLLSESRAKAASPAAPTEVPKD